MKRRWFAAAGMILVLGLIGMSAVACEEASGTASAETQIFGPKEAEVTIEDGNVKAVHLTSSKFMWKFRDDQEPVEVWGYNEQIPGPTLRFKPGDKVRIYYHNNLDQASSVHWHGLIIPNSMDGVGLLTQPAVMPGETFVYEFTIPNTPGTFAYHTHMNDLEQMSKGLTGAFVVDPRDRSGKTYDQDRIVFLNNIEGHYLINGKEFPNTDPWMVRKGDEVRVRMINMSAIEGHPMHFHGHFMREISRDGTDVPDGQQARVENTVWIAPGQTIDVAVKMNAPGKGVWVFHCHILSHVMGPDGTSLNIAEANGGMLVPIVYEDSLNIDAIKKALEDAVASIQPGASAQPATPDAGIGEAIDAANAGAMTHMSH